MFYIDFPHPGRGTVRFISEIDECKGSEAMEYINCLKAGEADGYLALLQTFIESGTHELTAKNFHPIKKELGLYQFIKGRHRLVCHWNEEDVIVICTQGFLKKTDPSPKDQISKANKLMEKYFLSKEENELTPLGVTNEQFFRKFL